MAVEHEEVKTLDELITFLKEGNMLQVAEDNLGTYDPKMVNNPYVARLQLELVADERMDEISSSELGNYGPKTVDAVNEAKDSRAGLMESLVNSGKFVDAEFADTYLVPLLVRQQSLLPDGQGLDVENTNDLTPNVEKPGIEELGVESRSK